MPEMLNLGSRTAIPVNWRDVAACLDEDPELFFPADDERMVTFGLRQIEEAKAVCRRCKVAETCLRWAIESRQDTGVWGGVSEDERRTLKSRNARFNRVG